MTVRNEEIANAFDEIADLLEIEEANPFRVRAYRNAARTVRGLGKELSDLVAAGRDLTTLPGIGKDLAGKITEMLRQGRMGALDELHKKLPPTLEDLLTIPGLGPKRVKALYRELNIESLSQLEKAASAGRLRELPGFGATTEKKILDAIATQRTKVKRWLRQQAVVYAQALERELAGAAGVKKVVIAGSYRRGKETIGDLDILVTAARGSPVMNRLVEFGDVREVVSRGSTRSTVVLKNGLQVDVRVVPEISFGAALHYFTGSKPHNIQVRRLGQRRGLKINEYGVFKGDRRIGGRNEQEVFKAVRLPWIPPELREGTGEIEAARRGELPDLIELDDIKGDLHVHTKASDGHASLRAMVEAARSRGLAYVAITDHSQRLRITHGLDSKRLMKQAQEIERLNSRLKGITVLKGVEVDILEDGSLDLPDKVLRELDLVIGAVHSGFSMARKQQTDRLLRALDHRYFTILAHPAGRLIGERDPIDVDMERVIRQAAARGCILELNGQPQRLDLVDMYCRIARSEGVLISINSDAHGTDGFDNLAFGVQQARRGWLEKSDVLNTRPLRDVLKRIRKTMG